MGAGAVGAGVAGMVIMGSLAMKFQSLAYITLQLTSQSIQYCMTF